MKGSEKDSDSQKLMQMQNATDDRLSQIAETLGRLDERTLVIQRAVEGNGQPGLKQRVQTLEEHHSKITGGVTVIGVLGAGLWGFLEWIFHFYKGGSSH
jgi:hypothetical protein